MADGPSPTGVGRRADAHAHVDRPSVETMSAEISVESVDHVAHCAEVTVGSVTVAVSDESGAAMVAHETEHGSGLAVVGVGDLDPIRWGRLAAASLERLGEHGEASLTFVDRAAIADLNAEHMGVDGETDVLSFPLDAAPIESAHRIDDAVHPSPDGCGEHLDRADDGASIRGGIPRVARSIGHAAPRLLGDIVICADVAADNAPGHAGTLDDELALLVVHGTLHLLGYDHAEADQASAMREREVELLTEVFWHGPVPTGFRFDHADEPSGAVSQGRST